MKIDMHYYLIKILCETAGLSPEDSQIVAYASQYVDDATFMNKRVIQGFGNSEKELLGDELLENNNVFVPILTAHAGLQLVLSIDKSQQKEVLVPFHFLPKNVYNNALGQNYSYMTEPDGNFSNQLVDQAIREFSLADNSEQKTQKLIKMGIALHTFGDTYSHLGFSGNSNRYNLKNRNEIYTNDEWVTGYLVGSIEIGHGPSTLPDQSCASWRYKPRYHRNYTIISNSENFIKAAKMMYKKIAELTNTPGDLTTSVFNKIKRCIESPYESNSDKKFRVYKEEFPNIDFDYQKNDWKKKAIQYNTARSQGRWPKIFDFKGDLKWFYFYIEAYQHKKYVIQNLPNFI